MSKISGSGLKATKKTHPGNHNGGSKTLGRCFRKQLITTDRDLQEPTHQPWRRFYGPFRNSRVVDWGIFSASLVFLIIIFATKGTSGFSVSGFNNWVILSFGGISVFYALGELYRRRSLNLKKLGLEPPDTNWYVLAILIAGIALFIFGGLEAQLFQPRLPDLTLIAYALISLIIGLVISYFALKLSKNKDLSL